MHPLQFSVSNVYPSWKSEHALRNDVFLDFPRAAINGSAAILQEGGRRMQRQLAERDGPCPKALGNEQGVGDLPAAVDRPTSFSMGTSTSSETTVASSSSPEMVRMGGTAMPGDFMSIRTNEMPSCFFGASGSVRTSAKV